MVEMRSGAVLLAITVLAAALAGCADDPTGEDEEEHNVEVEATKDTGVIRGVVVDKSITPVGDVTVTVKETEDSFVTGADGQFGFGNLEAGIYNLKVDAVGYGATTTQTQVVAGDSDPDVLKVQLEPDKSELPNVVPLFFEGYIDCSVSSPAYRVALCTLADPTGDTFKDDFLRTHEDLDADPAAIQAEMIWESSQTLGEAMLFTMEDNAEDGGEIAPQAQGTSPLVIRANQTQIDAVFTNKIMHRVFNYEHPATTPPVPVCGIPNYIHGGTMCAKGVGATIQQTFEIHTHVFYRFTPDEDWQFSIDGAHPTPDA